MKYNSINKLENLITWLKIFLFSISSFLIFFAYDGSFNIQVILPIVIFIIIITVFNKKIIIKKEHVLLLILAILYIICLIKVSISDPKLITYKSYIRTMYVGLIFLYFISMTCSTFSKVQIRFSINCYIIASLITALIIINSFFDGMTGKLTITTLFNNKVDPNMVAAFMNLAPLFMFIKIYYTKDIKRKLVIIFELFIIIFGIFLTGSRGAFVALAISVIVQLIFIQFKSKSITKSVILISVYVLLLFIIMYFLYRILPDFIVNRFLFNSYVDYSNITRISIWKTALNGVIKKPLLGYGAGNFNYYIVQAFPELTQSVVAHNTYLDILLETGVIGFFIFIVFLINLGKKILNRNNLVFMSIISNLFITSFIIGADRSVYFWNALILISIIVDESKKCNCINLKHILVKERN